MNTASTNLNNKYIPPHKNPITSNVAEKITPHNRAPQKLALHNRAPQKLAPQKLALHNRALHNRAPQKEFSLAAHATAFPTLQQASSNSPVKPLLSFAHATQTELKSAAVATVSTVLPGWVYIRYNNGEVEYKYGQPSNRYPLTTASEHRLSQLLLKYRLAKEQYLRDTDIDRLGDCSAYYGAQTIYDLFAEEERLRSRSREDYYDSHSSSSELDYDGYVETFANNKFENSIH
jgi:hypothetical protein